MADLVLHLKKVYFDQIVSGEKDEEYRLVTDYWRKRLVGRDYNNVVFLCGYPKRGDAGRAVVRPYKGVAVKRILHPFFGKESVEVFAINVSV